MAQAPIITTSIDQQFFVESLGGAQPPRNYLDSFPDTVYSTAYDSVLVTLLYALVGPVGAGYLRQQYLEARLEFEEAGLNGAALDQLYTSPFSFARLAEETYDVDANAALLTAQDREKILQSDSQFRNRAIDYLKAIRAGGTLTGIGLAAKSGLGHPVDVIENYKVFYDQYADIPLGLPYMGTTEYLNEIIVIPRKDVPQNATYTITFNGEPTSGWFTISVPLGPNYLTAQVGTTSGSNIVTVPNASLCSPDTYITIVGTSSVYAQVGAIVSPTSISVVYPPSGVSPGQNYNIPFTGNYSAYIGNAQTSPLPYNATSIQIQNALQALPVIGANNITVSGGPLPDQPIMITFIGRLGDQAIPIPLVNTAPDNNVGIGGPSSVLPLVSELTNVVNNPLNITANVTASSGTVASAALDTISPANEHAMQLAIDQLRPVTSFVTTARATTPVMQVPPNTIFAASQSNDIIKFETGNSGVAWPPPNDTSDTPAPIIPGKPVPIPKPIHPPRHYFHFHRPVSVHAYTEEALEDPYYRDPNSDPRSYPGSGHDFWNFYWDVHHGVYNQQQRALYPFLRQFTDPNLICWAANAIAGDPYWIWTRRSASGGWTIQDNYPAKYLAYPGVPPRNQAKVFWSSKQRALDAEDQNVIDYLEIDLGGVKAVNYIYFEITRKPTRIGLAYDILGQYPKRQFTDATWMPPHEATSITSVHYSSTATNPWLPIVLSFTTKRGKMIFSRHFRLSFTHDPIHGSPLIQNGRMIPYSIEVRNLRIGRNLTPHRAPRPTHHPPIGPPFSTKIYPSPTLFPGSTVLP